MSELRKACFYLWRGEALYAGPGVSSTLHRHYALQVAVGLDRPMRVRMANEPAFVEAQAFMIRPNLAHQIDASGVQSLFLWSEFEATPRPFETSLGTPDGLTLVPDVALRALAPRIARLHAGPVTCDEARAVFELILSALSIDRPVDTRVQAAMQHLRQAHVDMEGKPHHLDTAQLAREAYLSPSRFRHLFKAETGISVQRFLLWERLMHALANAGGGASLTQAAHDGGFADSAHLARFFRASFGVRAADIFKDSHSVQVIACSWP